MNNLSGVYKTNKKNGTPYYKSSITYHNKHISLGSFKEEYNAHRAYNEALYLIGRTTTNIDELKQQTTPLDYTSSYSLSFEKYIVLINFRDNGLYFSTPIYLYKHYFEYYLSKNIILKFDKDDLFFYASHKIQSKGGYLFVCDYGSQFSILSRYGIKPFAVYDRDYIMLNGDCLDYRYSNIKIINNYNGVLFKSNDNSNPYHSIIHINGNFLIGKYKTETEAAIAYNKAIDTLKKKGIDKNYIKNYIISLKTQQYKIIYDSLNISNKILNFIN